MIIIGERTRKVAWVCARKAQKKNKTTRSPFMLRWLLALSSCLLSASFHTFTRFAQHWINEGCFGGHSLFVFVVVGWFLVALLDLSFTSRNLQATWMVSLFAYFLFHHKHLSIIVVVADDVITFVSAHLPRAVSVLVHDVKESKSNRGEQILGEKKSALLLSLNLRLQTRLSITITNFFSQKCKIFNC